MLQSLSQSLLDPDAILPYFIVMAAMLVLGWMIVRLSPFYRAAEAAEPGRFESLDGLRGFLALAVLFSHASHHLTYRLTGDWARPSARFYEVMGPLAVDLFFMITGVLFWTKAIGKNGKMPPLELYRSRAWRIGPLYLLAMGLTVFAVFIKTGPVLNVSVGKLLHQLVGIPTLGLAIVGRINGVDSPLINPGVTWTLSYEWYFYLALPALALLVKPRWLLTAAAGWMVLRCWPTRKPLVMVEYLTLFIGGMGVAYLAAIPRIRTLLSKPWWSIVAIALIGATVIWMPMPAREGSRNLLVALAMSIVLLSLAAGNSVFGIMTHPATKVLGTISYSTYLLHGLVLGTIFWLAGRYYPQPLTGGEYWLMVLLAATGTVILSAITYRWVEHPGILRGRSRKRATKPDSTPAVVNA